MRLSKKAFLSLACALATLGGCNPKLSGWQAGIPGWATEMNVAYSTPRNGYLEATLEIKGLTLITFVPLNETCSAIFSAGAQVNYVDSVPGGIFRSGDRTCQAVGIGSLAAWRSRMPRPENRGGAIIARAQADYRKVYEDSDVVFLRGRFPLSGKLRWVGLDDLIAVVPRIPVCEAPISRNSSSMEYFPVGRNVLTLVSTRGQCPILGLITPYRHKPSAED